MVGWLVGVMNSCFVGWKSGLMDGYMSGLSMCFHWMDVQTNRKVVGWLVDGGLDG